jgi:hypothetical protein
MLCAALLTGIDRFGLAYMVRSTSNPSVMFDLSCSSSQRPLIRYGPSDQALSRRVPVPNPALGNALGNKLQDVFAALLGVAAQGNCREKSVWSNVTA